MPTSSRVWLTHEAHMRLQRELDHLLGLRTTDEPTDAASADFDQAPVVDADRRAARIRQIQDILRRAVVGEVPADDGVAEPGMVLTVRFDGSDETLTFLLSVREAAADLDGLQVYSPDSPLGTALHGVREGEQRTYTVPSGASLRVTLERAVPYDTHVSTHST